MAAQCDATIETSTRPLWLAAFLPLLVLYAWSMRTSMSDMSPDPVAVAPSAWALAHLGTPALSHTYWQAGNPWAVTFAHGQVVSNRTPGLVLLAAPYFWMFRSASPWDQYPASIAAAFVTAAAMATLALVVARIASARIALARHTQAATVGCGILVLIFLPIIRRERRRGLWLAAACRACVPLDPVHLDRHLRQGVNGPLHHPVSAPDDQQIRPLAGYLIERAGPDGEAQL